MNNLKEILEKLNKYEEVAFIYECEFLNKFALKRADTLLGIYFSSNGVKIYYIVDSGRHVTDVIDITEFANWAEPKVEELCKLNVP